MINASVFFEDNDQPYLQFKIEKGIITETLPEKVPYFIGASVNPLDIKLNKPLVILDKEGHQTITNHRIESIIRA